MTTATVTSLQSIPTASIPLIEPALESVAVVDVSAGEWSGELQDYNSLPRVYTVCTDVLHVRSSPYVLGTNVIGWLERGDVVTVREIYDGWGMIDVGEKWVQWVKLRHLCF